MLTSPETLEIDRGAPVRLVCEFTDTNFNLFDNPIVWRKQQRVRTWSSASMPSAPRSLRVPLVDVEVENDEEDGETAKWINVIETSQV